MKIHFNNRFLLESSKVFGNYGEVGFRDLRDACNRMTSNKII